MSSPNVDADKIAAQTIQYMNVFEEHASAVRGHPEFAIAYQRLQDEKKKSYHLRHDGHCLAAKNSRSYVTGWRRLFTALLLRLMSKCHILRPQGIS